MYDVYMTLTQSLCNSTNIQTYKHTIWKMKNWLRAKRMTPRSRTPVLTTAHSYKYTNMQNEQMNDAQTGNEQWMTSKKCKKNNTRDSNVVPHRSTNLARTCLTSLSGREAVLSRWYGRSYLLCHKTKFIYPCRFSLLARLTQTTMHNHTHFPFPTNC